MNKFNRVAENKVNIQKSVPINSGASDKEIKEAILFLIGIKYIKYL